MLERLEFVKIAPDRILDAASGPPRSALGKRYPKASVIALDFSLPMLRANRPRLRLFDKTLAVCADLSQLPIAPGAVDFIWCNMALHWLSDPLPAFREFARVLSPEGLLMFTTLGPDTLKELRAAAPERVHAFIDMHDLGDMLVAAGFSAPVMDMEYLTLTYESSSGLLDDLHASGQTNVRADRRRGLGGRRYMEKLRETIAPRATFEVVYGHAWNAKGKSREDANQSPKTVRIFKRMP